MKPRVPAVEGWFTLDEQPHLLGLRCKACGTVVFPPRALACPNPSCGGSDFEQAPLSRTGRVWSFAINHYAPPAPYVAADPFEPYTVAAVELDDERLVVLGQVDAADAETLSVGQRVELTVATLFEDGDTEHVVWRWRPVDVDAARDEP